MVDSPYDEFKKIAMDRANKDYWDFGKALGDSACIKRDHFRNWIEEEIKQLNYYSDILQNETSGQVEQDVLTNARVIGQLNNQQTILLRNVEVFIKNVEKRYYLDPAVALVQYHAVIDPVEELMKNLCAIRVHLEDILRSNAGNGRREDGC